MDHFNILGKMVGKGFSSTVKTEAEEQILEKLNDFSDLEVGWSFGEGKPIRLDVIEKAKQLYKIGNYFVSNSNVFAGTDGCILVVFYKDKLSIEFTINENLSIDASVEEGIGFDFDILSESENITLREAERILNKYKQQEWKFSDSFITNTTIQILNVSEALPSRIPQMTEVSPLLTENAYSVKSGMKKQYVTMS